MTKKRSLSFNKDKKTKSLKKIHSAPSILKIKKSKSPIRTVQRSVTYVNRPFHENLTKFNKEYLDYLIKNKKLNLVPSIPKKKQSAKPLFGSYQQVSPTRNISQARKLAVPGFLPKKVPRKVKKDKDSLENLTYSYLLKEGVTPAQLNNANYPQDIVGNMSQFAYPNKNIGVEELIKGKRDLKVPIRRSRNKSDYEHKRDRGNTNCREQSNYIGIVPNGNWHRIHIPSTRFVKSNKNLNLPSRRLVKSDRTQKEDRKSLRRKRKYYSRPRSI